MGNMLRETNKTKIRRGRKKAVFDRSVLYQLIDECLIGHVAFIDHGQAVVIPTLVWRQDDFLYIHGSVASRLIKKCSDGQSISISISVLDGLVLARSAFHHSANYRSAVIFGCMEVVEADDEKKAALAHFLESLCPGRNEDVRPPNSKELNATVVLKMPLEEVSLKTRTGPPVDDDTDMQRDVWAGVIPCGNRFSDGVKDVDCVSDKACPQLNCSVVNS